MDDEDLIGVVRELGLGSNAEVLDGEGVDDLDTLSAFTVGELQEIGITPFGAAKKLQLLGEQRCVDGLASEIDTLVDFLGREDVRLSSLAPALTGAGVDSLHVLAHCTETELARDLGVEKAGHRKRLLLRTAGLRSPLGSPAHCESLQSSASLSRARRDARSVTTPASSPRLNEPPALRSPDLDAALSRRSDATVLLQRLQQIADSDPQASIAGSFPFVRARRTRSRTKSRAWTASTANDCASSPQPRPLASPRHRPLKSQDADSSPSDGLALLHIPRTQSLRSTHPTVQEYATTMSGHSNACARTSEPPGSPAGDHWDAPTTFSSQLVTPPTDAKKGTWQQPRSVTDFSPGMTVVHDRRGCGVVQCVDDAGVKVVFDRAQEEGTHLYTNRVLVDGRLQPCDAYAQTPCRRSMVMHDLDFPAQDTCVPPPAANRTHQQLPVALQPPVDGLASTVLSVPGAAHADTEYEMGEELGRGAFGTVFKAYGNKGGIYAIKRFRISDQRAGDEAEMEFRMLKQLDHENIVRVCDFRMEDDTVDIVMEFMAAGSIQVLMQECQGGYLQEGQVRSYTFQTMQGLQYLHDKRIVHSDMKPRNLLVGQRGEVKLTDFGLSRAVARPHVIDYEDEDSDDLMYRCPTKEHEGNLSTSASGPTGLRGTIMYMSPGLVTGKKPDPTTDIWALGCTVLEMATGLAPWAEMKFTIEAQYIRHISRCAVEEAHPPFPSHPVLSLELQSFIRRCFVAETLGSNCQHLFQHPFVSPVHREIAAHVADACV